MEPGPSRKRRKGGTQQRQQQALEQQSCQSELHDLLVLLWHRACCQLSWSTGLQMQLSKTLQKRGMVIGYQTWKKYLGFNVGRIYRSPWTQGWQRFHPCPDQWMWTYLSKAKYLIFHPAVCYCPMRCCMLCT